MTNYALASKLRDMRFYPLETREVSDNFDKFLSNPLVRPLDIAIVNYVLDELEIPVGSDREDDIFKSYTTTLAMVHSLGLKNVNMDYWAYYNIL